MANGSAGVGNELTADLCSLKLQFAKIIPMNPKGCAECGQRVINLNKAIGTWVTTKSTSTSPITSVDCWTGFNTTTDTGDGVHPNDNGLPKLANCWYQPLAAVIKSSM